MLPKQSSLYLSRPAALVAIYHGLHLPLPPTLGLIGCSLTFLRKMKQAGMSDHESKGQGHFLTV